MEFAENNLEKMAKYRNRLTHFYFEVTPGDFFGNGSNIQFGEFFVEQEWKA